MKGKILLTALLMAIMAIAVGCGNKTASDSVSDTNTSSEEIVDTNTTEKSDSTTSSQGENNKITEDEAKKIALDDAKASEDDVKDIEISKDTDDGVSVYEVEFNVGDNEYEYKISTEDGSIRSKEVETENDSDSSESEKASVTINEAKKIALKKVDGATKDDISIKQDKDDGKTIYKGSIEYNKKKYEFKIDSETGKVLSWKEETVNDDKS